MFPNRGVNDMNALRRMVLTVALVVLVIAGIAAVSVSGSSKGDPSGTEVTVPGYDRNAAPGDTSGLQKEEEAVSQQKSSWKGQPTVITGTGSMKYRTRLVLLGTTGGIAYWPATTRATSSSALVVGDTIYIVDMGQGSTYRLSEAFNTGTFVNTPGGKIEDGSPTFLKNVKALFLTHLHQDHTADYPNFLMNGPGANLGWVIDPNTGQAKYVPLQVFGPPNRGQLEDDKTNYTGTIVYTDSSDPELITSTPGTRQMTALIMQAFAQTVNDMTLDNGYPDFTKVVKVTEIGGTQPGDIPLPVPVPDPNNDTCPAMDPFEVYRDDQVRVTCTLVDHHQVFPAFAYRFDTADGSVTFSGDTGKNTKGNLQKLANGSDVLVHEVIDRAWINKKFGNPANGTRMYALKEHMLNSHTTIDEVGQVATDCNVNTLILYHLVPGNTPNGHLIEAKKNLTGKLIIGEDLMQIGIGRPKQG